MNALDRATAAAQKVEFEPPRAPAHTRTRILAAIAANERRRRTRVLAAFGLLTLLVAPGAWAAVTGKLEPWLTAIVQRVGLGGGADARPKPRHPSKDLAPPRSAGATPTVATGLQPTLQPQASSEPNVGVVIASTPATESTAPARTSDGANTSASSVAARARVRTRAASAASKDPAPPQSAGTTPLNAAPATVAPTAVSPLYLDAHRAHFVDQNPAQALVAWDRYLAALPNDRFAPEARYNRAICLLRLGRHAEAEAALLPFAHGDYGSYRAGEAERLLKWMKESR